MEDSVAWVGVDVGGSGVRAAKVMPGAGLGPVARVPLADRSVTAVVSAVGRAVHEAQELTASVPLTGVGVGVPGFVHDNRVLASPNFPAWHEVPLRKLLREELGLPVTVENDANCAALGVAAELAANGAHGARLARDVLVLTLGTGVGGGVITGGTLVRGAKGTGAELGHVWVDAPRRCGCGAMGCVEAAVGTWALVAGAAERGLEVADGAVLVAAADGGDPRAVEVMQAAAQHLGRALCTLVNVFAPAHVSVLGGLAGATTWWAASERMLRERAIAPSVHGLTVSWGGRADQYAILGAAAAQP